jgi:DNA repair protein RadA/Sms
VEVPNASAVLLSERADHTPGTAVTCCMEGTRPVLVELQALVSTSSFGNPRRMATGVDYNRMVLLMAVLEKKMGLSLYNQDAYVNVVGGLRLSEPAADLGVIISLASSYQNKPVSNRIAVVGEVGLSGEVRSVSRMENRIGECVKLGFSACILPQANIASLKHTAIRLIGVRHIGEAIQAALYTPET